MRPELPDYGVFTRWPGDGHEQIHPDDVSQARHLLPSDRIFRREQFDGVFYRYKYGSVILRLRPSMWLPVRYEGFDIGDLVEVSGLAMARQAMVGRICEARFNRRTQQCEYTLSQADVVIPRRYTAVELKQLTSKTQLRKGESGHPAPVWDRRDLSSGLEMDDNP